MSFVSSAPMSMQGRYADERHWPAVGSCAKLPLVANIALAESPRILRAPRRSKLSLPKLLATLLSLFSKPGPVVAGNSSRAVRTLRRTYPQEDIIG